MEERSKRIVERFGQEAVTEGNCDAVDERLAEGYLRQDPTIPGKAWPGGAEKNHELARTAFPDLLIVMTIAELIADGDLVAFRATETGTHEGKLLGVEPTGIRMETTGLVIHRIEDGRIAETWASYDSLGILQRIDDFPILE